MIPYCEAERADKSTTAAFRTKGVKKVPPERPCGEQCGGLGAQSPHQTGLVFLPEADVNAPEMFSGAETWINGTAFFKPSLELKIKGGLIPEAAAEEIIGELQALFARYDAGAALSAKVVFKPTKEFHTARHTMYSADENMEIDSRERWERSRQISRERNPARRRGWANPVSTWCRSRRA